jgi:hypothetical protein
LTAEPQANQQVVLLAVLCVDERRCAPSTPLAGRPREVWRIEVDVPGRRVTAMAEDPKSYQKSEEFTRLHGAYAYLCRISGEGCLRIKWDKTEKTFARDAQLPADPAVYQPIFEATKFRVFDLRIMPDGDHVISLRADSMTEPARPTD